MPDWLLVARANDYGLTRDAAILAEAISAAGGSVDFAERRRRSLVARLFGAQRAGIVIHIERVFPRWFGAAAGNWLVPNQERFPARHLGRLKRIDRVLAKTREAEAVFAAHGVRTDYLGFTSPDRRDMAVVCDYGKFFHLAGGSTLKGTEDLLALWAAHPEWPELALVQKQANAPAAVPANVRLLSGYLPDAELRRLQSASGIHLCPSRAEGWGHHIVEALSVGAVTVVTDAPPMNEHVDAGCGVLVPVAQSSPRHLGTSHVVDRAALEAAIRRLIAMPAAEKEQLGRAARQRFEAIDAGFRARAAMVFRRPSS